MNGVLAAAMVYGAIFGLGWLGHRMRLAARATSDRQVAAVFTALMMVGIGMCVTGPPYIGDHVRLPLGLLLGVCVLTSWTVHPGVGAAYAVLFLPIHWFVGAVIEGYCTCRLDHFHGRFPWLQATLFVASLAIVEWSFRRPVRLPRAELV